MIGNALEHVMDRDGTGPDYRPETDLTENVYRRTRGGSFRHMPGNVSFSMNGQDHGSIHMTVAQDYTGFRIYCEP
jgi:hypothetical protein